MFSSVVKALDLQNNNNLVAIKIIRNMEITRKSGEKERTIIMRLNDLDKAGKSISNDM